MARLRGAQFNFQMSSSRQATALAGLVDQFFDDENLIFLEVACISIFFWVVGK
jgi:hypothetical protein